MKTKENLQFSISVILNHSGAYASIIDLIKVQYNVNLSDSEYFLDVERFIADRLIEEIELINQ